MARRCNQSEYPIIDEQHILQYGDIISDDGDTLIVCLETYQNNKVFHTHESYSRFIVATALGFTDKGPAVRSAVQS